MKGDIVGGGGGGRGNARDHVLLILKEMKTMDYTLNRGAVIISYPITDMVCRTHYTFLTYSTQASGKLALGGVDLVPKTNQPPFTTYMPCPPRDKC